MGTFTFNGEVEQSFLKWLTEGMKDSFKYKGYTYVDLPDESIDLVFNLTDRNDPRPFRRHSQGTFVVSILQANEKPDNIFKEAYPYLVRTLSNHFIYAVHTEDDTELYFLTPEQGLYHMNLIDYPSEGEFFNKIVERIDPVASSQLVINNDFYKDLPEDLWDGDEVTHSLSTSGEKLDSLNLLPAPFPLEEVLTPRDIRFLKKLYGIGGLSYGNLSARKDENHFWMSASGIDKSNMQDVGRDFLYIKGYDEENKSMKVSVPPNVEPRRASVDAIEHWKIYTEHPTVGAIVHVHAWMDNIEATQFNYPCGTIEMAESVADLVRKADDPSQTIIGLKNHGITITGKSLEDIFERIEGKIIPQVPMQ